MQLWVDQDDRVLISVVLSRYQVDIPSRQPYADTSVCIKLSHSICSIHIGFHMYGNLFVPYILVSICVEIYLFHTYCFPYMYGDPFVPYILVSIYVWESLCSVHIGFHICMGISLFRTYWFPYMYGNLFVPYILVFIYVWKSICSIHIGFHICMEIY